MPDAQLAKVLQQRWLRSREEESGNQLVFRPANYDFPPARGRTGFEFKPDGTLVDIGIGPTDRRAESTGAWSVDNNQLTLRMSSHPQPDRTLRIVTAEPDRLVLEE